MTTTTAYDDDTVTVEERVSRKAKELNEDGNVSIVVRIWMIVLWWLCITPPPPMISRVSRQAKELIWRWTMILLVLVGLMLKRVSRQARELSNVIKRRIMEAQPPMMIQASEPSGEGAVIVNVNGDNDGNDGGGGGHHVDLRLFC